MIEFKEGCNKMYKTELTIIKDSPSQMVMEPTKVTMLTEFSAEQWTKKIECSGHLPSFKFGTSVILHTRCAGVYFQRRRINFKGCMQ